MVAGSCANPEHRAEPPRVVVTDERSIIEHEVDVIMQLARRRPAIDAKAAGHAEVYKKRVCTEAKQ